MPLPTPKELKAMDMDELSELQREISLVYDSKRDVARKKAKKDLQKKYGDVQKKYTRECAVTFTAELEITNLNDILRGNSDYIDKELKIKNVQVEGEAVNKTELKSLVKDILQYEMSEDAMDAIFPKELNKIEAIQEDLFEDLS